MFGFTKREGMKEHEFAKFLRKHGAVNTWRSVGNSNQWYCEDTVVAVAVYTGQGGTDVTYWTRYGLR